MTALARLRRDYALLVRRVALRRQALYAAEEWLDRIYKALVILEGGKSGLRPELTAPSDPNAARRAAGAG